MSMSVAHTSHFQTDHIPLPKSLTEAIEEDCGPLYRQLKSQELLHKWENGDITEKEYMKFLKNFGALFAALEAQFAMLVDDDFTQVLYQPLLFRSEFFIKDLDCLTRQEVELDANVKKYSQRLKTLGNETPHGLLAHALILYRFIMDSQQKLKQVVEVRWRNSASVFCFDALLKEKGFSDLAEYLADYQKSFDSLSFTEKEKEEVIAESRAALEWLKEMLQVKE